MEVIKLNKLTGEKRRANYPAIWPNKIIGLDENLEFFEIEQQSKPSYNPIQYELKEIVTIDVKAVISYEKTKKSDTHIILALNDSVGKWIDSNYPLWEQNKHTGKVLRYFNLINSGKTPTVQELRYIDYIQLCADWATECRDLRDEYQSIIENGEDLPIITWPIKPIKPF